MPNRTQKHRQAAFHRQHYRCCYCLLPMWEKSPLELGSLELPQAVVRQLQCTAEHLVARKDGGKDIRANIAAACLRCNSGRHKRTRQLSPEQFKKHVQRRINQGRWHNFDATKLAGITSEAH
ncbi:HNH endonuclease [Inhella crocodyli]|uniref:Restriction endonuclease n=1 Tax=Inhella crocodyli TaxID=2499851 RepID=A0A3S2UCX0_9BURK|nr:restriction endonuclease [Inhella crocodyli]